MVQMEPIAKIGPEEAAGEKDLEKNAILDLAPTDMIKRASSSRSSSRARLAYVPRPFSSSETSTMPLTV